MFLFIFLIIDLNIEFSELFIAVIAQVFNSIAELVIPIGTPINEEK